MADRHRTSNRFWSKWWAATEPELSSQLRDTTVQAAALASIGILFLFERALELLGVDPDLLEVLSFIAKWGTVTLFAMMFMNFLVRSFRTLRRSIQSDD